MKETTRRALFILLVVLMVLTFYAIFNAGNPHSLFRYVIRDARYDVAVTLALSACIVVLALLLTAERSNRLKGLLDLNRTTSWSCAARARATARSPRAS